MALSYVQKLGDGITRNFDFAFEYLSKRHVTVMVNGVPAPFTWASVFSVQLATAPAAGAVVEVRRTTPREERLVSFTDGSTLVATDLNTSTLQSFFLAQEAFDQGAASMAVTEDGQYSAQTRRITNVGSPVNNSDVVNKEWALSAANTNLNAAVTAKHQAETARTAAQTARTGAETARTGAETARTEAQTARTDAQSARDSASGHRLNASNHEQAAKDARDVTITKLGEATTQAGLAQTARVGAETARTGAQAAEARAVALAGGMLVPTGAVIQFATQTAPAGYLVADGSLVSRAVYPALFTAIGTTFGAGDGSTTFALPNLVSQFVRGAGPGRAVGSTQADEIKSHTHAASSASAGGHTHTGTIAEGGAHTHGASTASAGAHTHTVPFSRAAESRWDNANSQQSRQHIMGTAATTSSAGAHTHTVTINSGGAHTHTMTVAEAGAHTHTVTVTAAGGTETRPANIALLYCIKT